MGFGQLELLQQWPAIHREQIERRVVVAFQAEPDRRVRRRPDAEGVFDRDGQSRQAVTLQEPQNLDVFASAVLPGGRFKTPTQHVELLRQLPVDERLAVVERRRATFRDREEVDRIVMRLVGPPVAPVRRDHVAPGEDADRVDVADHRHLAVVVLRRHGIIVAMKTDEREAVHFAAFRPPRLEFHDGKPVERRHLFAEQFADRLRLPRRDLVHVLATFLNQQFIEGIEVVEFGNRDEVITPRIADGVLDVPLLLRLPDPAKPVLEEIVRGDAKEFVRRVDAALAVLQPETAHGDARVVERNPPRNAFEKFERPLQGLLERFGAFLREDLEKTDVAVRQGEFAVGDLRPFPGNLRMRETEIELGLARRMRQRNINLPRRLLQVGDRLTDRPLRTGVTMLVA